MLTRLLAHCTPRIAWRFHFPLRPVLVAVCWLWLSLLLLMSGQGTHAQLPPLPTLPPMPTLYEVGCSVTQLINAMLLIHDNDVISLAAGCTYTLTKGYGGSITGLPQVSVITTIQGHGAIIQRSLAAGTPDFRLFYVGSTGNLTLQNVTLRQGNKSGSAIFNSGGTVTLNNSTIRNNMETPINNSGGTVTLNNSTISDNTSNGTGGIYSEGGTLTLNGSSIRDNTGTFEAGAGGIRCVNNTLTVNNSTISGNSAPNGYGGGFTLYYSTATLNNSTISGNVSSQEGGGIYVSGSSVLTLNNSTISGNTSSNNNGGGIFNAGATVMVSNSTVANNTAAVGRGGGIYNSQFTGTGVGNLTVANSTIADNSARWGGGIGNENLSTVVLGSSIILDNTSTFSEKDLQGAFSSLGYNIVGVTTGATITGTMTGNQFGLTNWDVLLGALANNGGPTKTMRLGGGSAAINHGNCTSLGIPPVTTDQRGVSRASPCDVGAYENTPPTISSIANLTINEDGSTGAIPFTIGDVETPLSSLTLIATTSNDTIVPLSNIVFGGSGANRTITVTPVANLSGNVEIWIYLRDGGNEDIDIFSVTINPVNDLPTISDVTGQTTLVNIPLSPIPFTIGDVETAAGSLTMSGTSSNTTLLPNSGIVFSGSGANRTVRLLPAANQTGTTTVTLTVQDANGGTRSDSFTLWVQPLIDPLFDDGFESGTLSAWSSADVNGGFLRATSSAALTGSFGMRVTIDDTTPRVVTDDTPTSEAHYRARFLFDPNSLTMANNDNFSFFFGYQGASTSILQAQLRRSAGAYQVRVAAIDNGGNWVYSPFVTVSDAPHMFELDWLAATAAGANNGALNWWLDEAAQTGILSLNNDSRRVDQVRLGTAAGIDTGTSGTIFFDAFISRRFTYIGWLVGTPTLVLPADGAFVPREPAVLLDWNAVTSAEQYYVEFSNGTSINLNSGWITGTDWSPGVQPQGTYTWRVKARLENHEEGNWSATRTLTVRPGVPTNLQGSALSMTQVSLTWNVSIDAPAGITGYRIYRAGVQVGTSSSSTPSFTDNAAPACTANEYKVRSVNGSITSLDSNIITVNTLCDAIFSDGFEAPNLSAWSLSVTDGTNLASITGAQLTGSNRGLRALINDANPLYVGDDTPIGERRYRARFYFDPNSVVMANNDSFSLFYGFQGTTTAMLQVQLRKNGSAYELRVAALDDAGTWLYSNFATITNDAHMVEFDWKAATGTGLNNGTLSWWIDETAKSGIGGMDSDTRRVDRVRLGAVAGMDVGTSGTIFFDAFRSRRLTYIGAEIGGLGMFVEPEAEPTDERSPEVIGEPTAEITPEATGEPTVEPTAAPTETPTPEPTAVFTSEPTVEPTLLPFSVPVFQTMDDGAPLWSASAGWQLSAEVAYNGLGWLATASGQVETLALKVPVTLGAAAPMLGFQSKLVSGTLPEVRISLDGTTWQTVAVVTPSLNWAVVSVDLSAFAGQTIRVQFVWASPAGASDTWQVDEVTIVDGALLPPVEPTATATPVAPGTEPTMVPIPTVAQRDGGTLPDAPADLPPPPTG
jgi:hypothetical protein